MENIATPTALILSRQNIKDLPSDNNDRYSDALKSEKGAYIVQDCKGKPDIILVASGSEVSTLVEGANLLRKDNLNIRIVSAPSEGLFRNQSEEYCLSVIPEKTPVFGLTAGLPVTLQGLVGRRGKTFGLSTFGFSAPYKILDEQLGFTPENVYKQVIEYLAEYKTQIL
jgi:transketolase